MSLRARICEAKFLNNPAKLTDQFQVQITFELSENLPGDFEFELVYVGAANTDKYDQVLETVVMGPLREGRHRFVFDAPAPVLEKCVQDDIAGVTLLILNVRYIDQRFMSVNFFVANEYTDQELIDVPPTQVIIEKLMRFVKDEDADVRVNVFSIDWEKPVPIEEPEDEGMEVE